MAEWIFCSFRRKFCHYSFHNHCAHLPFRNSTLSSISSSFINLGMVSFGLSFPFLTFSRTRLTTTTIMNVNFRMFFFHVQALYNVFSLIFSWFALANLWLTFSIIIDLLPSQQPPFNVFGTAVITHWVNLSLKWVYLAFLALQVSFLFVFTLFWGERGGADKW
jgi:hypothetical protein